MSDYYAGKPRHTQLMDPADDPEEFIRSSIYWYPLIFPTRTEVLEHVMLTNGNGYEWGKDGNIRSVFSDLPLREEKDDFPVKYEREAREDEERHPDDPWMAGYLREQAARLAVIRDEYRQRARTYGPVRMTDDFGATYGKRQRMITSSDLEWTLLGRAPANVTPAWRKIMDETREIFAPILMEQGELF